MKIGITAITNIDNQTPHVPLLANVIPKSFIDLLTKHDITPIIIPVMADNPTLIKNLMQLVDGIILVGGQDITPQLFNQQPNAKIGPLYKPRDDSEMTVLKEALNHHKPVLGICRGFQLINVGLGGSLYQDLALQKTDPNTTLQHEQQTIGSLPIHDLKVTKDSHLAKALGPHPLVNSRHHQAINQVANSLKVVARAEDGVIEALENDSGSIMGVQWHPEDLWQTDPKQESLFVNFFNQVRKQK